MNEFEKRINLNFPLENLDHKFTSLRSCSKILITMALVLP